MATPIENKEIDELARKIQRLRERVALFGITAQEAVLRLRGGACGRCKSGTPFSYAVYGPTRHEVFCDNIKTHRKYDGKCYWLPSDCCEFWELSLKGDMG
jgi:hypothetical protein